MSTAQLTWFKSSYSSNEGGNCIEVAWVKSSYSNNEGGECIEVAWAKSSYSSGEGGNCIEVATTPATIHVRDSKDKTGPALSFPASSWTAFLTLATTTR
ncbi:DUF397 domain-containing protein [Kitasatospora sp. NBC_01266]|uniref:DUF397 domain-containing protein n=1 Tax=Kitasatospora sp. NBC_01266 TaxID=2903572 RepID=UPI002E340714|nr:DUF397 domain-containing protein [Kitasatospora sp. NBC_01266]